jgi:hypothetical protein
LQALQLKACSVIQKYSRACRGLVPEARGAGPERELRKHFKEYFRKMKIKKPENAETARKNPPFRAVKTSAAFRARGFPVTARESKTKKNRWSAPAVPVDARPWPRPGQWPSSSISAA